MIEPALLQGILAYLGNLHPLIVYLVVGVGAAIENIFPPIPADTFVFAGAFISEQGRATPAGVFLATWLFNVGSALGVYQAGRSWGRGFFATPLGHWLLRPRQLERLGRLYARHGSKIIFVSRFLPGFRALVPVFAGVSRLPFWRTALPLGLASAIWYGLLVLLGTLAGRNWEAIFRVFTNLNSLLAILAGLLAVLVFVLWWRTRHHHPESAPGGKPEP
ncbi:MAG: DedA family protein [Gemmatimonadota bacterium]